MPRRKETVQSWLATATETRAIGIPLRRLTARGLLPASLWGRLPLRKTFRIDLDDGSGFLYSSTPGDFIGRSVYWRGLQGYEGETATTFCRLARSSRVILDIGANTGFFTLMACAVNPAARVIAFEPVPRIFERLRAHVALNGWTERCQLRQVAVSNRSGTASFHVPLGELPYSASMDPNGYLGVAGELIEVALERIDDSCAGVEGIDLVKIDVEGFEDQVLDGMRTILAGSAPSVLLESIPGRPVAAIEAILHGLGYRFHALSQHGLVPVETLAADPGGRGRNVLAIVPGRARGIVTNDA